MRRLLALPLLLCCLVASSSASAEPEVIDRIAAVVNDTVITQTDLVRMLPIYAQVIGVDPSRFDSEEGRNAVAEEILEYLVVNQLLIDSARIRNLSVTDSEVEAYVTQQREAMGLTIVAFRQELEAGGIDLDDFRDFVRGNLTRVRMMQLDLAQSVAVSDEDVARAIASRYPDGLVDRYILTSHIIVGVPLSASIAEDEAARTRIDAIAARLADGESFEVIASLTNTDASRSTGGRLGRFRIDELDQDYVRAAMALEPGEISAPVRTQFGYHIIRLEALATEPVADAEEAEDRIRYELYAERSERQQDLYLERVRSQGFVEIRQTEFDF